MKLKAVVFCTLTVAVVAIFILQQKTIEELRRELAQLQENRPQSVTREQNGVPVAPSEPIPSMEQSTGSQKGAWEAVEVGDYGTYMANLRALGCPEQVIRDIIIADLERNYSARVAQLTLAQKQQQPYWRVPNYNASVQYGRELAKIEEEKRLAVRELLGVELEEEMSLRKTGIKDYAGEFDFLSEESRRRVVECQRKYDSLAQELAVKRDTGVLREDEYSAQIREIYQRRDADAMSLLGPAEAAEYQMRRGDLSYQLPRRLEAFEPSEEEYRKIYSVERDFYAQHSIGEQVDPVAEKQHQDALRAALGEQRYAEYRKASSGDYFTLYKIAEEFSLPRVVADTVYQMQPEAEAAAAAIRNNTSLSSDAKAEALKAFRAETEMQMVTQLGETGYYHRYLGRAHFWLDRISP
jgi:hypothetical protein